MKLCLDANVFISALFWSGAPQKVLNRVINGYDELYTANEILDEVAAVLIRPKFNVDALFIAKVVSSIKDIACIVRITGAVSGICRDSDDDKILECAMLGNVDYIVTGDADLLELQSFCGIPIVKPNDYLLTIP